MRKPRRFEIDMIEPIRELMLRELGMDVVSEEFSAGYGVADLVGAEIPKQNREHRQRLGIAEALDHRLIASVLLALRPKGRSSVTHILSKVPISESTLKKRILPRLASLGVIEWVATDYVALKIVVPNPADQIVAVEAKQTKWREAILQARRYTFFANRTYLAVWNCTVRLVDRRLLYRHRIGLVSVEADRAMVIVKAPVCNPRERAMNRYCAEYLYGQLLG